MLLVFRVYICCFASGTLKFLLLLYLLECHILTISTKSRRQRDVWCVGTDQHVPGNNVEAAQDRVIFGLNHKGWLIEKKNF